MLTTHVLQANYGSVLLMYSACLDRPEAGGDNQSTSHRLHFQRRPNLSSFRKATSAAKISRVDRYDYPQLKKHAQLEEDFVELGKFSRSSTQRSHGNLRSSRIHNEIRDSGANPHPDYDIFICEPNMGLWKVVIQGSSGSSYAGGTFLLYLDMGAEYPVFAPAARFATPIYHSNINRHGRICHSILDRNWTVDTSNKNLLDTIYSLLLMPEFSDPILTLL